MSKRSPLIEAARILRQATRTLKFVAPVAHVYRPLEYAWEVHELYLKQYGRGPKRVLFLGMNPGPFGMVQTGVPFGEVTSVADWLGVVGRVGVPDRVHPKRPVEGFACQRSEVSGRRLWGLFAERFGTAERFFSDHFVVNYCPLAFLNEHGANLTPDKLSTAETARLYAACDAHLHQVVAGLSPEWVVGIGDFAEKRARLVFDEKGSPTVRVGRILHPSPASPAANRDWKGAATKQMLQMGAW